MVYAIGSTTSQLLKLYYLVLWKGYPEEKNTGKPLLAIQYLQWLTTAYHKDNLKKPTATSLLVNMAPPMPKPTTASTKKYGQSVGPTTASTKKRG